MKNNQCLDCGKQIWSVSKRCSHCCMIYRHKQDLTCGFQKGNQYGEKFKIGQPATSGSYKKGHGFSFETICKMKKAKIGKRLSPSTEFKKNPNVKNREYRRKHHLGNPRYVAWRNKVFMRDNWVCQICNQRGNKLHAHHKRIWIQYPKERYWTQNGLTVCENCHKEIHFLKIAA